MAARLPRLRSKLQAIGLASLSSALTLPQVGAWAQSLPTVSGASAAQPLQIGRPLSHQPWKCDVFENPRSQACLGPAETRQPNNLFERLVQTGATHAGRYGSALNAGSDSAALGAMLQSDAMRLIAATANEYANKQIQKIPFFAYTSIGVDFATSSDTTLSLDSLLKLKELGRDAEGDVKGLLFAQAKAIGTTSSGATTNLGLGVRHRLGDTSMVGANVFWDYRFTEYSSSYSRWGIGAEAFWKSFELRNNWYVAGTGIKAIQVDGTAYDERVVPGWDVELGYRLPNYPELGIFVRGFNWDYMNRQDNGGVMGSLNWQATPHVNLEAWVSNEIPAYPTVANNQLGDNSDAFFGVRFRLSVQPVTYQRNNTKQNLIAQMTQPVRRRYEVLLERWKRNTNNGGNTGAWLNQVSGS